LAGLTLVYVEGKSRKFYTVFIRLFSSAENGNQKVRTRKLTLLRK
jgi:hypothetical protein